GGPQLKSFDQRRRDNAMSEGVIETAVTSTTDGARPATGGEANGHLAGEAGSRPPAATAPRQQTKKKPRQGVVPVETGKIVPQRPGRPLRDVEALAGSIQEVGLLCPLLVCHDPGTDSYRLVAGRRRLAAVKLLGWKKVPCSVLDLDGLQAELAAI